MPKFIYRVVGIWKHFLHGHGKMCIKITPHRHVKLSKPPNSRYAYILASYL